jgi:Helicase associated domain
MAHPRRSTTSLPSLEVQAIDSHSPKGLEALPDFIRKLHADQWEEGFFHLKRFCEVRGHCRVSDTYRSDDGYSLGVWVSRQRGDMETMEVNRRQRLEGLLPGWRWDGQSVRWDLGFSHLKQFYQTTGHCRVPKNYKCDDDYALGEWVLTQRRTQETMKAGRRKLLEAMAGWTWNAFSERWQRGFSNLKQFADREGHCLVPRKHKTDEGYKLGQWVNNQRTRKAVLERDRIERLEALRGWAWKLRS